MKRLFSVLLAAVLLAALVGCDSKPAESSLESAVESFLPEKSILTPVRTLTGEYGALISVNFVSTCSPYYIPKDRGPIYSVQKSEKWGLINENETELLGFFGDGPVYPCPLGEWMLAWQDGLSYEEVDAISAEIDRISAELEESTGYPLCFGHGGGTWEIFLAPESDVPQRFFGLEGGAWISPLEEEYTLGDQFFPVHLSSVLGNPEEEIIHMDTQKPWNFSDMEGNLLFPDEEFDQVGWFYGEALAPVQKDGKWAYVNAEGRLATEFVYDSCWGGDYFLTFRQDASPCFAYSMWEGAAVVCREGKWGVLDQTGKEAIPCAYDDGAPYPGGAILKKDGQWGIYLLNE